MRYQAAPSCEGSCPAGYYCGKKTVGPVPCQAGTFCPEESAAETACPAGTYSNVSTDVAYNKNEHAGILGRLATSDKACLDCGRGTFCPERSKQPLDCAPGTYGNESRLQACYACASGTFQGLTKQVACKVCKPGSYCQEGAVAPTPCPAGRFSNATDLSRPEECEPCTAGFYCEKEAIRSIPCPMGKVGIGILTAEAFCTTCPGETTSLPGTTSCTFCAKGFYESAKIDGPVAKVECVPCLEPDDGTSCSETTTSGNESLMHGSMSLATIRIKPKYWRLSANSTTLSMCLESADGSSSCVGGSNAGGEDDYKKGYTGSGYCKAGHTGPLCQVCNTSDFYYFDSDEAMECIQCPRISERLDLPMGCIGVLVTLLLTAFIIKRSPFPHSAGSFFELPVRASKRCSERLGEPIAEVKRKVKRVVARTRQLEIVPRCKLLFT